MNIRGRGLGSLILIYSNSSEEVISCLEGGGGSDKKKVSDDLHSPTFNLGTCGKMLRYVEVQSYPYEPGRIGLQSDSINSWNFDSMDTPN